MSTEDLTYSELAVDTEIVSLQTGERGMIRSLAGDDGMIAVKIIDGPDAGDYVSMSPAEILTYWREAEVPAGPLSVYLGAQDPLGRVRLFLDAYGGPVNSPNPDALMNIASARSGHRDVQLLRSDLDALVAEVVRLRAQTQ